MSIPARLSLVTLGVADLRRSTAFYESLGWRRSVMSNDQITFFGMAGSVLGLFGRRDLADDAGVTDDGAGFRGVTCSMNLDQPADVDTAFAEWVAAGATPVRDPHSAPWGGYIAYVADPDGHLWELAHNPYMPLDQQGRLELAE